MAINPDNFIFHSDFWYPTGYLYGTKTYTGTSIPANFEMSDQYHDGDFYNVYIEYPDGIGERFLSDTIIPYTDGNKLMVFKGAQSVGATFTAKLHWRIYPKNTVFNFNSTGLLEQTAKSLDGFITAPGSVNSFQVDIPSGLTGKYFPRGTWQIEGGGANIINGSSSNGGFNVYYDFTNNKVKGFMTTYPGVLPAGTKIFYKIQLVPVTPQDVYIFNSDKYSFAIPSTTSIDVSTGTSIPANGVQTIYGPWTDVPGTKTAYDLIVKYSAEPGFTYQHYREMQIIPGSVVATANLESNGTQVRPVLTITNYTGSTQTYSAKTVTFGIYMYQNNNTS